MDARLSPYLPEITSLCARHQVRRLELFGSAAGQTFDPATSDVDFLVEFADLPPGDYAEQYFAFREGLVTLLGREVDLVVERAIRNPHFLELVGDSRELLFAA
jgi:predicted nucleotidyltransferase